MNSLTITRRGGFAAGAGNGSLARGIIGDALDRADGIVARFVAAASPVKTGFLRDHWFPIPVAWQGQQAIGGITNEAPYAAYQNMRTRNRGYIERGIANAQGDLRTEMQGGLERLAGVLWDNEATR
jgi:hypothetical protein